MMNDREQSNREQRLKTRYGRQKKTLLAMTATFALILLVMISLLIATLIAGPRQPDSTPDQTPDSPSQDSDGGNETPTPDTPTHPTITRQAADVHTGALIVVNRSHRYEFPDTNTHLTNIYDHHSRNDLLEEYYMLPGREIYMESTAYRAMHQMLLDFSNVSGLSNVLIASAYRTYEMQQGLSVPAGYSDSHTGLSAALRTIDNVGNHYELSREGDYNWIFENCHRYGFVVRYPEEKADKTGVSDYENYFRYVGVAHAALMRANNMCLEEYVTYLQGYSIDNPIQLQDEDASYTVYYVAATGTQTAIPVPTQGEVTVSGDNVGGFIVTVTLPKA